MAWADPQQDGLAAAEANRGNQPVDQTGPGDVVASSREQHAAALPGLLGLLAEGGDGRGSEAGSRLLDARSMAELLRAWAAVRIPVGERLSRDHLLIRLGDDLAAIDAALSQQVDAILHHPSLQRLESSWRGLLWLVDQVEQANEDAAGAADIAVRVLPVSKRELRRDRESSVEFDRSHLWRKVYEEEFGSPGGTPYGLLVTDFEFSHQPDDVNLLGGLSEVAMAAFAPLLVGPDPRLLGIESLADLDLHVASSLVQTSPEYVKWRGLRERAESRFVGMPLPRVLARLPYDGWLGQPAADGCDERTWSRRGFRYRETHEGPDGRSRLWMSAVWPLAGVVVREFGRSGWFADIRGGSRVAAGAGVVDGLPCEGFDGLGASQLRGPAEAFVTDAVQVALEDGGFIPLCSSLPDGKAVFHSNSSLHRLEVFDDPVATSNAAISSMLQYVLCVSRFAHYLKVIGRDKVGGFAESAELRVFLSNWINEYVTPDDEASPETRARMPLRAAEVDVMDDVATPGEFRIVMRLQPHFQIDRLDATLRLVSTLKKQGR